MVIIYGLPGLRPTVLCSWCLLIAPVIDDEETIMKIEVITNVYCLLELLMMKKQLWK